MLFFRTIMMNTRCKHSTDMTATVTVLSQPFNSTMSWCRSRVICSQILLERILFLWVTGHFCSNEHFRTMLLFLIHFGVHSKNRGFRTEFNCCRHSWGQVVEEWWISYTALNRSEWCGISVIERWRFIDQWEKFWNLCDWCRAER